MSIYAERVGRVLCVAFAVVLVGCFDETSRQSRSGAPMVQRTVAGAVNAPPVLRSVRLLPARPTPGDRLQGIATADDPDGDAVQLSFAWEIAGRRILSTEREIVVPEAAKGSRIQLTVVATDGKDESEPMVVEARLGNRPPRITELEIEVVEPDGAEPKNAFWRVSPVVKDPDGDITSHRYEWLVNGTVLTEGTDRLAKSRVRRGDELRVRVVAFDGEAESPPLESAAISIGNGSPIITSTPPGIDSSGTFRYLPEVEDPNQDSEFTFRLIDAPEGMSVDSSTGELTWKPSIQQPGSHPVRLEVADHHGGSSRQVFQLTVRVGPPSPGPASTR